MNEIKYIELIDKLDNNDSFVLYIGGNWCKNCRPIYPIIKQKSLNTIIYNYDSRDNKEEIDDIRKCNNELQIKQYKELISKLNYKSNNTVVVNDIDLQIPLIKVPTIFAVKHGKIIDSLTKEYLEEDLTDDIINDYEISLNNIIEKITHH